MPLLRFQLGIAISVTLGACGPGAKNDCGEVDFKNDPLNCGGCGTVCADGFTCIDYHCTLGECEPGVVEDCYTGGPGTMGVGPCHGGTHTCDATGTWSKCDGEVVPVSEGCAIDNIDQDCNGINDDGDIDHDGDGFTACGGDCCDTGGICTKPELVNPGAFDAPGNLFDDDCDGQIDNTALLCDQGLSSSTQNAMDYAKALDICQTATDTDRKWGVISAKLTLADGTGTPDPEGHAIRPRFGANVMPQGGLNLAILSTGGAGAKGDTNPGYHPWVSYTHAGTNTTGFPADFLAANGGMLPNAPGCPAPSMAGANDAEMLTLRVRVPTNAKSFQLSVNFFSAEFPEYTCTAFNDFFVVLLDSAYTGQPANPMDKNLAFFQPTGTTQKVPVGVNLAYGNTGLFTQCVNGKTGCNGGVKGTINTCTGTQLLAGTGFDDPNPNSCDATSLVGGATGWLVTSGNVVGGEVITLRIGIWDTSDHAWDSAAVIDGLKWSTESTEPGTVIFRERPPEIGPVQIYGNQIATGRLPAAP